MPSKRNNKAKTDSPSKKPKKGGGGGKRYDVIQKSISGDNQNLGTFPSNDAAQEKVAEIIGGSRGALKEHDFEIVPSK